MHLVASNFGRTYAAPGARGRWDFLQQFGDKLGLVMKIANISRGRLAASVGVDKSVVSRWLNDAVRPSGHNLTLVTNLFRQELPGFFSLLTWELDYPEFARAVGAPVAAVQAPAPPADAPMLELATVAVSRTVVPREGLVFPGLYVGFRKAYANNGMVVVQGLMLRIEGDRLAARCSDGLFTYRGEALLLRGQLFVLVEETTRLDEILTMVLSGVTAPMADVLDGLIMGVSGDRTCTPSATTIVYQRQADVTGDDIQDDAAWQACIQELARLNGERRGRELMPPEFARVIDNLVGVPRDGQDFDHVLRIPFSRSFTRTTSTQLLP